ncbi:MAG: 3-keto-disaccharide hydrolase [Limisphaerales bacterium]
MRLSVRFVLALYRPVVLALVLLIGPLVQAQFYGVTDPVMGDYEGFWSVKDGKRGRLTAQIRALGDGAYEGFVLLNRSHAMIAAVKLTSLPAKTGGTVSFSGTVAKADTGSELLPGIDAKAQISRELLTGSFSGDIGTGTLEAKRVAKKSPTAGAPPPSDAVVLFDGKDTSHWENFNWKPLAAEGAMEAQNGDLQVKDKFTDFKLHLEFRTPFKPAARGQERGNSGVYLQRKYEVQILDSFGLFPLDNNDCAAIYKIKAPAANACLPPMQWQTYDITYHQGDGGTNETPSVTIVQNGVTVIDNVHIPADHVAKGTGGGDSGEGGFLKLQFHKNPVQFRNIWVEPLK